MEGLDHPGVELAAGPLIQFSRRSFIRPALTIDAVAGDGVESIRNREDAGTDINIVADQTQRITGTVPLLVVLRDDARGAFQELNIAKNLLTVNRMLAHENPFFVG